MYVENTRDIIEKKESFIMASITEVWFLADLDHDWVFSVRNSYPVFWVSYVAQSTHDTLGYIQRMINRREHSRSKHKNEALQ